jgi:hypothetical protein
MSPTQAWKALQQSGYTVRPLELPTFQCPPVQPAGAVRFVCISDTHSKHTALPPLPDGDCLVHAGDWTQNGDPAAIDAFCTWLEAQPHARKIVIAGKHPGLTLSTHSRLYSCTVLTGACNSVCGTGNHDLTMHGDGCADASSVWGVWSAGIIDTAEGMAARCAAVRARVKAVPRCEYLCCSGTQVGGVRVWGAPWVPTCGGVFTKRRGEPLQAVWAQVPADVDVLLTHGPPLGHGDVVRGRGRCVQHVGCVDLLAAVVTRVRPRYHIFGHIHEGYGVTTDGHTTFVNAAACNERGQCGKQAPLVVDVLTDH